MPRGRQLPPVILSDEQRGQWTALVNSTSMPHGLVQRVRIIVAGAEGRTHTEVAAQVGASLPAVGKWRRRFLERGVQGLHDELRPPNSTFLSWSKTKPPTSIPRCASGSPYRPRYQLHFTPTSASWLNQVERWFGLISQRAIQRGSFHSVSQPVNTIKAFLDPYNASTSPFLRVATAESIFGKLERLSARICGIPP